MTLLTIFPTSKLMFDFLFDTENFFFVSGRSWNNFSHEDAFNLIIFSMTYFQHLFFLF